MAVIVVGRGSGRTWRLRLEPRSVLVWFPVMLALLLLLSGGFAVGYWSQRSVRPLPPSLFKTWAAQIDQQRQEVAVVRSSADEKADALSRKLAQLQAQVMRLDAAGQRMAQIAGIKSNEFNFNSIVAEGGPELPISKQPAVMDGTLDSINALSKQLSDREREMHVLEDILLTNHLQKEIIPSGWPISHGFISSGYGERIDPFTGHRSFHPGVDIAGPEGAPVHAVAAGIITRAGPDAGYGNLVEINHGNGYETLYGHNEKILVHVGERVHKGQTIALEGSTGRSTGPHCHFEVRINGGVVNPARFVEASR